MGNSRDKQLRVRMSQESARIIMESGIKDYFQAKKKAAKLVGCRDRKLFPSNQEIEQALQAYQSLFYAETQSQTLVQQRRAALEAMHLLKAFTPRLVGRVLLGTAMSHSTIVLHVFSDSSEAVMIFLLDRNIPFESGLRQLYSNQKEGKDYPIYTFEAGNYSIQLVVFPVIGLREAPRSPVDGKRMERADSATVEAILATVD